MPAIIETYEQYAARTGKEPPKPVPTPDKELGVAINTDTTNKEETSKEETEDGTSGTTRKRNSRK